MTDRLDPRATTATLESLAADQVPTAWATMDPVQLVDHLESTHHRHLWDVLPRLADLCAKVDSAHGANRPELAAIRTAVDDIRADLEPHLMREEQWLFPLIRELAAPQPPPTALGSVDQPISMMLIEHDVVAKLLAHLRDLTDGYRLPEVACDSYTALFDGLERLEANIHLLMHKENTLLFPMVERLEQRLASQMPNSPTTTTAS